MQLVTPRDCNDAEEQGANLVSFSCETMPHKDSYTCNRHLLLSEWLENARQFIVYIAGGHDMTIRDAQLCYSSSIVQIHIEHFVSTEGQPRDVWLIVAESIRSEWNLRTRIRDTLHGFVSF